MYFTLALVFIVTQWAIESCVSLANTKALSPHIPPMFAQHIDAARYARSQEYTRANAKLGLITNTLDTVVIVLCLIGGLFGWLDSLVMSITANTVLQGVLFFGILGTASSIIHQPFALYRTFVLEERFGFNRTTIRTYIADRCKGLLLTTIIAGPLLYCIICFFARFGGAAWLPAWGVTVLLMLLIQYIAPVVILPLFNKFTPLAEGELRTTVEAYMQKTGFALSGLFVMDGSKRSGKANAFFTGFGKRKRIALFDTLINSMSTQETLGVVAHEVGHSALGHVRKMTMWSIGKTALLFGILGLGFASEVLLMQFGFERPSVHGVLLCVTFLYTPISFWWQLWAYSRSRKHEYEADAFAARTTDNPEALASALTRLSVDSLTNLTPHPWQVALHYSHPPVSERITALRRMAPSTPSGS